MFCEVLNLWKVYRLIRKGNIIYLFESKNMNDFIDVTSENSTLHY
jgi:hypothetical protein